MGQADYLKLGSHNAICDGCGFKFKAEDLRMDWRGLMLCANRCWDPRHPQEFLRGVPDNPSVENARPDVSPTFAEAQNVYAWAYLMYDTKNGFGPLTQENLGFILLDGVVLSDIYY